MDGLIDDLVTTGHIDHTDADRFVSIIHDAAHTGHFSMSLTMFAVIATTPP
jgi:hypothetical protein